MFVNYNRNDIALGLNGKIVKDMKEQTPLHNKFCFLCIFFIFGVSSTDINSSYNNSSDINNNSNDINNNSSNINDNSSNINNNSNDKSTNINDNSNNINNISNNNSNNINNSSNDVKNNSNIINHNKSNRECNNIEGGGAGIDHIELINQFCFFVCFFHEICKVCCMCLRFIISVLFV